MYERVTHQPGFATSFPRQRTGATQPEIRRCWCLGSILRYTRQNPENSEVSAFPIINHDNVRNGRRQKKNFVIIFEVTITLLSQTFISGYGGTRKTIGNLPQEPHLAHETKQTANSKAFDQEPYALNGNEMLKRLYGNRQTINCSSNNKLYLLLVYSGLLGFQITLEG